MSKRDREAFTLVELLVVIAIIALLVSILMPSLMKAQELARRAACQSNLHNLWAAAMVYAGGQDCLPTPELCPSGWQSLGGATYNYVNHLPGWDGADWGRNGWALLTDLSYLDRSSPAPGLVNCPSMDFAAHTTYHYDYRFNGSPDAFGLNARAVLNDGGDLSWRILFSDSSSYRLLVQAPEPLVRLTTDNTVVTWLGMRWAHVDGGHVATVSGEVRWIKNYITDDPLISQWSSLGLSTWPGHQWPRYYVHTGASEIGLDVLVREGRNQSP